MQWILGIMALFLGFPSPTLQALPFETTHFIKHVDPKYTPPYQCHTHKFSKAISFTRRIGLGSETYTGKVKYKSARSEAYIGNGEYDCNLISGKCENWAISYLDKVSNFQNRDQFPPIFDRRWNDLQPILISRKNQEVPLLELDPNAKGTFFLSVLGEQATIVFARNGSSEQAFAIVLNGQKRTPRIEVWDGPSQTNKAKVLVEKTGPDYSFTKASDWALLTISYKFTPSSVSLKVEAGENEARIQILNATVIPGDLMKKWHVKTIGKYFTEFPSIFRLHKYEVLQPKTSTSEMRSGVIKYTTKQAFCLMVTYYGKGDDVGAVLVAVKTAGGVYVTETVFKGSPENAWTTMKFTSQLDKGTYYIYIQANSGDTFIGDVRFCVKGPELAETNDWVQDCHEIDENILKPRTLSAILKSLEPCDKNMYGPNCEHDYKGHCTEDEFDPLTGHCSLGCSPPEYKFPFCIQKTLEFEVEPEISQIEAYSAVVDITAAMDQLQKSKSEVMENFDSVEILILRYEDDTYYEDRKKVATFNLTGPLSVTLENLIPNSEYNVVALIREKNDPINRYQRYMDVSFDTLSCVQPGKDVSAKDPNLCRPPKIETNGIKMELRFETDCSEDDIFTVDGACINS